MLTINDKCWLSITVSEVINVTQFVKFVTEVNFINIFWATFPKKCKLQLQV